MDKNEPNSSPESDGIAGEYLTDSGLNCLVVVAHLNQIPAQADSLHRAFSIPGQPFSTVEIIRAAKSIGLKARSFKSKIASLDNDVLPGIACDKNGEFFILAKLDRQDNNNPKALIQRVSQKTTQVITLAELESQWSGEILLLSNKKSLFSDSFGQKFDISWFIPALKKYKKHFTEVVVASFFLQLFALITPLFFQVVMDKVLLHNGLTTLDVLAIGFFVMICFEVFLGGFRTYLFSHTTNRVDVELGSNLFQHLMRLPLAYFENRPVGQNVARVRELDSIRNFITGTALTLVIDLLFTIIFFAVMWLYSPTLTIIVLLTIPFYIVLSILITPILRRRLDEKFKHGAQNQAFLVESVTGIETIKALALESQMHRNWENQLADYVKSAFRAQNLSNIAGQVAAFINKITTVLIIYFGAKLVMTGDLSVGQLIAFNMIAGRVSGPILKLVQVWQDFQQASISIARLGDILNTPAEPGFNTNRTTLPEIKGQINFDQITFRYRPDGPAILNRIALQVGAGEVIGIVGRSGSGKSTLTKLVQRLYTPESGRVLIDNVDIAMVETAWLRKNVGVVLQENFLFNKSIRDNIAMTNPGASMDAVIQAAQLAGAHEFITELADGYDTCAGEQGCQLSGGQRQRIAIARALITNPRILIFDEATSALDYESEKIIQENMNRICASRTVFIIAHRLSTVRQCNRIVVMEKGEIAETGNHHQLIAQDGYYARLHRMQQSMSLSQTDNQSVKKAKIQTSNPELQNKIKRVRRSELPNDNSSHGGQATGAPKKSPGHDG